MPGHVKQTIQRFQHVVPAQQQDSPYHVPPCKYGTGAQDPLPQDTLDRINEKCVNIIQQVISGVLYYALAVDLAVLSALSSIASEQVCTTKDTKKCVSQLLDYLATHPDAEVRYHASDMVLNIHSDASYLSEIRAKSRMAGQYFPGSVPQKTNILP